MIPFVLIVAGLALLTFGGEYLVRGASRLATNLGMSAMVIGLTIVAIGTSMPELVTSIVAQSRGEVTIALANIIGSNIANIALVLGAGAVLATLPVESGTIRRDLPFLAIASVVFAALLSRGSVGLIEGIFFLLTMVGFIVFQVRLSFRESLKVQEEYVQEVERIKRPVRSWSTGQCVLAVGVGLLGLIFGARWMIDGAVMVAEALGMSARVIGLTIVAVGTSLPELATTLIAIRRGEVDVAVGNVIGSNIANMLLIGGSVAVVSPALVDPAMIRLDLPIMVGLTLLLTALLYHLRQLPRWLGFVLLGSYAAYVTVLVVMN